MINLCSLGLGNIVYTLIDDGIANVLEVQTLRHGTNPYNYLSIRFKGGDPKHGGKPAGSTKGWSSDKTENFFYVFKNKEFPVYSNIQDWKERILNNSVIEPRLLSRVHASISGYNFASSIIPSDSQSSAIKTCHVISGILGGISSLLFSPTLRFRMAQIDPTRFENDEAYGGAAYKTQQKIEAWRIGLLGSLIAGINYDWAKRVTEDPASFVVGVAQLTTAVAITALCLNIVAANPHLLIPAAIGALLA